MHTPTDNATPPRSAPTRLLVRWRESYNNPRVWVGARYAAGVFNFGLGVLLLSYGYWLGAVPLAGAALIFWTVYRLTHSVQS
jgi:hypothetical protein